MKTFIEFLKDALRLFFGYPKEGFKYPAMRPIGNGDYELLEDYSVTVSFTRGRRVIRITVRKGFRWDGASVPSPFWSFLEPPTGARHSAGSVIHDALYRAQITSRIFADMVYAKVLVQAGFPYWKTILELVALRKFGDKAWSENAEKDVVHAMHHLVIEPV